VSVRIICAGLATVDIVHRVDRIPGVDEKAQALSAETAAGGPATNAAVTAAALGADVTLVTAVGAHPLGDLVRDDLRRHGVRLIDAAPDAPEPPPVSAIAVLEHTGQRTIVSRNAGGAEVRVPDGPDWGGADAVLVDGHHPALARAAAGAGRPLVVDAGTWRPVFADVVPYATVVACSAAFRDPAADGDGDAATAAALRARGARHVAVTHGPDPVRWWSGDAAGEVAVPAVAAVDTAGAGDAFHGALAVAVARDPTLRDLPAILAYAVAVAGVRVRRRGPRSWLADLSARPPGPAAR
jgi:sugar/nucleoside kinase (ribokinase family)